MPKPKKLKFSSTDDFCRYYEENVARYGKRWGERRLSTAEILNLLTLLRAEIARDAAEARAKDEPNDR